MPSSSSRSSHGLPASWPISWEPLDGLAPRTPQLGNVSLPPSPISPYGVQSHMPIPPAPRMEPVSLPPSGPPAPLQGSYGLVTPPHSPHDMRRSNVFVQNIHPLVAYNPQPSIGLNVVFHPSHARVRPPYTPASMQEGAFAAPRSCIIVRFADFDSTFSVVPSQGVITVADILLSIFKWVNQQCSREFCNRFSPAVLNTASLRLSARNGGVTHSGDGLRIFDFLGSRLRFMGLAKASDGSDCWDLHLANIS